MPNCDSLEYEEADINDNMQSKIYSCDNVDVSCNECSLEKLDSNVSVQTESIKSNTAVSVQTDSIKVVGQ